MQRIAIVNCHLTVTRGNLLLNHKNIANKAGNLKMTQKGITMEKDSLVCKRMAWFSMFLKKKLRQ